MSIGLRQFHATLLVQPSLMRQLRRTGVVVGKNYRLQNIQLSKISWGPSPQAPARSLASFDSTQDAPLPRWGVRSQQLQANLLTSVRLARSSDQAPGSPKPRHRTLRCRGGETTASTISPTSVGARLKSLTRSPKLFQRPKPCVQPASALRASARQPSLACRAVAPQGAKAGGEYRARTGDLLVANQALSQLS